MSDKIKLLPCPFCGSTNLVKSPWIECDNCGAMGPSPRDCDNYPGGWNRRATLAQQPAAVAQEPVAGVVLRDSQPTLVMEKFVKLTDQRLYTAPPAAEQPDDTAMPGVLELLRERRELDGDARYLFGDDRVWAEKADAFLVSTAAEQPACPGCNGHGLVGGFVSAESGYDAEECQFCCGDGFIHGTECGACAEQPDTVAVRRKLLEDMHIAIADYVAGSRRSRLESLTRSKELRVAERRVWLAARALLGKEGAE